MRRLVRRAPALLAPRWLPHAAILLALLLVSPCLTVGPLGDDYMHMARVDPRLSAPGFAYAPLDLFTFASGDPAQRAVLREEGIFGWWMAPDFRMAFWRPLSSLTHVVDHVRVSRPDATTLRVRPERGFLDHAWLRMVRGPSRPFRAGDEVALSDVRVLVRDATADGRPAEADFTFRVPLEDPSLVWMRLRRGGSLVPWSPPAVGGSQVLPSVAPQ